MLRGLDNPRGLTLGKDGALYVAEAGRGGAGPCRVVRGENQCYGPSGAVSRLHEGVQERIVTGLDSYAPESGAGATGPHDVSRKGGRLYVTIGLGGPDAEAIRTFFDHDFGSARFRRREHLDHRHVPVARPGPGDRCRAQ